MNHTPTHRDTDQGSTPDPAQAPTQERVRQENDPAVESGSYYTGGPQGPAGSLHPPQEGEPGEDDDTADPSDQSAYLDGALVTAGAVAAEASDPDTAAGAAAPLSHPALATAPQGEDGPLVSEADPTSNAG